MPKPHVDFQYHRADEVAETWDGVSDELYRALWLVVPTQRPIPNIEDSGPGDHVGHENLASKWALLSEAHQVALNELAAKRSAELDKLMGRGQ